MDINAQALAASRVSWNYNWWIDGAHTDGFEFYPMVWGAGSSTVGMRDSKAMFTFNEPNMITADGGSAMDMELVVRLWPEMEALALQHGVSTLVGPSVANIHPGDWYNEFFQRCPECRVDAIGFHAYSCDLQNLKWAVDALKKFGKPLWLTEFACADNPTAISGNGGGSKDSSWQCKYMQEVIPYLEGESSIARYAWFSIDSDYTGQANLVLDGRLTELGSCYNNLIGSPSSTSSPTFTANQTDVVV